MTCLAAQGSAEITRASTDAFYTTLLDPDGDGFITESGLPFTTTTGEKAEFEIIPNSTTGWVNIIDVDEKEADVTPSCGTSDIVQDGDGGDFGFYNIIDPTPASPISGDEHILFRIRVGKAPSGNFGYNFLLDSDRTFGASTDPNAVCGNPGYEREVKYTSGGNRRGVNVFDVNGFAGTNRDRGTSVCPGGDPCTTSTAVQYARAASGGGCTGTNPTFISFGVPLSTVDIPSTVDTTTLFVTVATKSSGNATSVLGGGNATDIGGLDRNTVACDCSGLSGCNLFDCRIGCLNASFVAASAPLPVTFSYFTARLLRKKVELQWGTQRETDNSHFDIERSSDGTHFDLIARIAGRGTISTPSVYRHLHPGSGNTGYYRIKQVDFDSTFSYTPIISVAEGAHQINAFTVYPTLVSDGNLNITSVAPERSRTTSIELFDPLGRRIRRLGGYANTFTLPIGDLPRGSYTLRIVSGRHEEFHRFTRL